MNKINASPKSQAKKPAKRLRPGGDNSPGRKNNINRNSSNRNNNGRNTNNGGCTCKPPAAK